MYQLMIFIMEKCWEHDQNNRPSFKSIIEKFLDNENNLFLNVEDDNLNNENENIIKIDENNNIELKEMNNFESININISDIAETNEKKYLYDNN
jgi:hypothetical protein